MAIFEGIVIGIFVALVIFLVAAYGIGGGAR